MAEKGAESRDAGRGKGEKDGSHASTRSECPSRLGGRCETNDVCENARNGRVPFRTREEGGKGRTTRSREISKSKRRTSQVHSEEITSQPQGCPNTTAVCLKTYFIRARCSAADQSAFDSAAPFGRVARVTSHLPLPPASPPVYLLFLSFKDYCDIFLTHDSASVRKAHNGGWKHRNFVQEYYSSGHRTL